MYSVKQFIMLTDSKKLNQHKHNIVMKLEKKMKYFPLCFLHFWCTYE
jgi:hypothetical protein